MIQCTKMSYRSKGNTPSIAAITAVRPATRLELLPQEGDSSITPVPTNNY